MILPGVMFIDSLCVYDPKVNQHRLQSTLASYLMNIQINKQFVLTMLLHGSFTGLDRMRSLQIHMQRIVLHLSHQIYC